MDYIEQTWVPQNNGTLSFFFDMPSLSATFLQGLFLIATSFLCWGLAAPVRNANDCPGYTASNVVRSDSSITADLNLAGPACNLHSQDLNDLKFLAEWQTGMSLSSSFDCTH